MYVKAEKFGPRLFFGRKDSEPILAVDAVNYSSQSSCSLRYKLESKICLFYVEKKIPAKLKYNCWN